MNDFFKYLTPGEEDRAWGIFINDAGKANILPDAPFYPSQEHPTEYHFTWEKGRILNEFQINYITHGSGVYETRSGRYPVKAGSLLVTRPGTWHRYRPDRKSGWTENYAGFDGRIPREIFSQGRPWAGKPVHYIGNREEFIDTYHRIFEIVLEEKPGFQQVASGMIMKLLGFMVSLEKQRNFSGKRMEKVIREVCFEIRENIGKEIDFKGYAEQNNMGYSYFRKMFKQYTGIAPVQYQLDLKIRRAREMLASTDLSIKEIAFELGFQSIHYFSRIFKKKTGVAPSQIRKTT
ncbi:MAG: AraC family transcriptional regulator [Bacteroidales bacterium]|nr:AraC family transcriptional regulator [Bacteroidales bacterium]